MFSAIEVTTTSVDTGTAALAAGTVMTIMLISLLISLFFIVCFWKVFTKAGKPGWASIIPIYNVIVWLEIIGRPIWWVFLLLIPFVSFVVGIMMILELAEVYGKGLMFAIFGLMLFPIIGWPMLAFGSAQYAGPISDDSSTPSSPAAPTTPTTPAV